MNDSLKRPLEEDIRLTKKEHEHIRSNVLAYMCEHPRQDDLPDVLREDEKTHIRTAVLEHMRNNPAEEEGDEPISVFDRILIIVQAWAPRFAAVFFGVLFLGASATYASDNALPGDYLYTVKLFIKETVPDVVSRSTRENDVEIKAQRSIERLLEAEQLLLRGEESGEVWEEVRMNTAKHIDQVRVGVETLSEQGRSDDAKRVAEELEAALTERKRALKELKDKTKNSWVEKIEKDVDNVLLNVQRMKDSLTPTINLPAVDNVPLPFPVFGTGSSSGQSSLNASASSVSSESTSSVSLESSASSQSLSHSSVHSARIQGAVSSVSAQVSSSTQQTSSAPGSTPVVGDVINTIDDVVPEDIDDVLGL